MEPKCSIICSSLVLSNCPSFCILGLDLYPLRECGGCDSVVPCGFHSVSRICKPVPPIIYMFSSSSRASMLIGPWPNSIGATLFFNYWEVHFSFIVFLLLLLGRRHPNYQIYTLDDKIWIRAENFNFNYIRQIFHGSLYLRTNVVEKPPSVKITLHIQPMHIKGIIGVKNQSPDYLFIF